MRSNIRTDINPPGNQSLPTDSYLKSPMRLPSTLAKLAGIPLLYLLASSSIASPLDDQIAKFKDAATQNEGAVSQILQTGMNESRSAEAFAAVKPWLTANPSLSEQSLFRAAQSAERAGEWSSAVSFYRKLLSNPKVNSQIAADAVPATYRLLINYLNDPEAAYLYMKAEGARLRNYGDAKRFDRWFLTRAEQRNDLVAISDWLTAVHNSNDSLEQYEGSLSYLLKEIETFNFGSDALFESLKSLASAKRTSPELRARLNWVMAIVPTNERISNLTTAKQPIPDHIYDEPVKAANDLINALPYEGTASVIKGWLNFNVGDSGAYRALIDPRRDDKAAPVIAAVRKLPVDQASKILSMKARDGKEWIAADYLLSMSERRKLVADLPEVFNALNGPRIALFDNTLTPEEAKAMAPSLAMNPHGDSAMVRMFAKPERRYSAVVDDMMRSEMWRFNDIKTGAHGLWHSGMFERDVENNVPLKKYAKLNDTYQKLKQQVGKKANSKDRLSAFASLKKDLLSSSPSIPGALSLWDELFASASDADTVAMFKSLTGNLNNNSLHLLHRAIDKATFKKSGKLQWQADVYDNHFRYHQKETRDTGGELIKHLENTVKSQAKSGTISETIFGMWMHAVDPKKPEAIAAMKEIAASPAYSKLDAAYRRVAADSNHFGIAFAEAANAVFKPTYISRELIALPADASDAEVEAAFAKAVDAASKAPAPVAVIGITPVANMETWSPQTRQLILSLFKENAPLGSYPSRQGYEAMLQKLCADMVDKKDWSNIETHIAGLWNASASTDDPNHYRGADAISKLAETLFDEGLPSLAMTVTRGGLKSEAGKAISASNSANVNIINGRLKQVTGKAAVEIGAVEIPVAENDASYPIYKSNAEFIQGNLDTAWDLYNKNADQLQPVLRALSVEYGLWLLERNIQTNEQERAENLVKELTIWSRQAEGTFSLEQDAQLKISYADLAFRKGALPTARAWYRKVADSAEYEGSAMHLEAALGSVMVDRVSKNFSSALTELDKLMRYNTPGFRNRVRYARAEVFMDQENYAEALEEVESVLRQEPKHPDALILRGKIQYEMRKLVEASEIELGPSQDDTLIVPGEAVKINLRDPTLQVSGVGADIEVEIWAKSGDRERVLLYQLGDSKDRFRAEVPTELGPPTPGDKKLQILGEDEIRFGYSKRFREMMDDLPADPDVVIGVASDANLALTAGAFPPRTGERKLDIEELGLSTAQAALGTRAVRPGNPIYLRVNDPDQSKSPGIDEIVLSLSTSSGDEIRRLVLKETSPFSGEFQTIVQTTGAQAMAFASQSAPGRDPNMAISSKDYPGWQGEVGDIESARIFGVDLNDNAPLNAMTIESGSPDEALTHFVLQTSMNGKDWTTRARYPGEDMPVWDGKPLITSFPTFRGGISVSNPEDHKLPQDWLEKMELSSNNPSVAYLAANAKLSDKELPAVNTGHPGYSGLFRYRVLFYQPAAAIRRFKLSNLPLKDKEENIKTIFLLDGLPAAADAEDPLLIERELAPGLHELEFWVHMGRSDFLKLKPAILCDEPGKDELIPCPDSMFDPSTFPEGVGGNIPQPATISTGEAGKLNIQFGDKTQARMVRLVIQGFKGVAPTIKKVTMDNREGDVLLPVKLDYMELRENDQLEVLPGDQITASYEDPVSATPKRNRQQKSLGVAYNTGTITASFLNYEMNRDGERELVLEPIRRFRYDDAVAIVVEDADLDGSPKKDVIDIKVTSSNGGEATLKAVETEEHSGIFLGRVFPVEGEPSRSSEITLTKGGTLTAIYRDMENLDPGIPADRTVTISHAIYGAPNVNAYSLSSETLPAPTPDETKVEEAKTKRSTGPEIINPRRTLSYSYLDAGNIGDEPIEAVIGANLTFDVVMPHMALAPSSEINAYVQTDAARSSFESSDKEFDVRVPGTLKLRGALKGTSPESPRGYTLTNAPNPPTNEPPLEEGRFTFSIPLILGDTPERSFATKSAAELPDSAIPDGLAVKAGDIVHVGFPWQDEEDNVHWKTLAFKVVSHAILDVMENGYREDLFSAFVGEKIYLRLLAPGLDRGPERDETVVTLKGTSGASTEYELKETEAHSGIFKGVFTVSYADEDIPSELPPVALNGFPVLYGDSITITYQDQTREVNVNKGADGIIEPFSKRYTGDEMAVRTSFTLAECYFELAKKHREMEQESLARREIGHARKMLAEALATHRDEELKAHAEYLLGNLAQEFADLAKNDESKLPMYQDALARFIKIPTDYPDSEFAPKAQFKTALVYEKMGEIENSVEEYVKLSYKYPDNELIPTVMSRLGGYFQKKGQTLKEQADVIRENEDEESQAEVLRLDELSYPEFLNAAMVFSKLQERFPNDALAGLAGLRAAQNYMRAHQYNEAIDQFQLVIDNEEYDGLEIRSQAIYWQGLSHERAVSLMGKDNWKGRGQGMQEAYELYRRVTFDFPDSKWAKYARGRLADPVFADIIERERSEREKMIEALKEANK